MAVPRIDSNTRPLRINEYHVGNIVRTLLFPESRQQQYSRVKEEAAESQESPG